MKPSTSKTLLLLLCTLSYVIQITNASAGDRSISFQKCIYSCKLQNCRSSGADDVPTVVEDNIPQTLPLSLRLTRWTCTDDCAYWCMHQLTEEAITQGRPILQYYGKWPFWRVLGMQEPASVFFSLMNLWVHVRGYRSVEGRVPDTHPMKMYLLLWSVVNMNAWICSAVFHVRDKPTTEKLDYFSAALVFIVALCTVVSRFFFVGRPSRRTLYNLWTFICITAYISHVSYLSLLPRFDYTYNIIFNLIIGLLHNFLWLLYSLPQSFTIIRRFPPSPMPRNYRPRCAWKAALSVSLTMGAMSLELLDFPPIGRVLDAHALWHAATAPIAELWYGFLIEDALDDGWKVERL
ncbi:hypothetical protein ACEPAI_5487 [Sanghuangporus weigelae]